ncbi:hypothetical protein CFO_g2530 [Ceratocystis platani]|uniref:Uncharacterized protein n=1 Tax=Ceratocystis fimbriata f. sp. platani TaxID=88771 RepID=A0A0F8CWS7_CERFI|nr:hypothetical protein CFO_g2530 [Ceratocystis platani]
MTEIGLSQSITLGTAPLLRVNVRFLLAMAGPLLMGDLPLIWVIPRMSDPPIMLHPREALDLGPSMLSMALPGIYLHLTMFAARKLAIGNSARTTTHRDPRMISLAPGVVLSTHLPWARSMAIHKGIHNNSLRVRLSRISSPLTLIASNITHMRSQMTKARKAHPCTPILTGLRNDHMQVLCILRATFQGDLSNNPTPN